MCLVFPTLWGSNVPTKKVFLNYFTLIGTFVLVYTEKQAHKSYRIVFFFLNSQRFVSARVGLCR